MLQTTFLKKSKKDKNLKSLGIVNYSLCLVWSTSNWHLFAASQILPCYNKLGKWILSTWLKSLVPLLLVNFYIAYF